MATFNDACKVHFLTSLEAYPLRHVLVTKGRAPREDLCIGGSEDWIAFEGEGSSERR